MADARSILVPFIAVAVLFGVTACGSGDDSRAPETVVQTVTAGAPPASSTPGSSPAGSAASSEEEESTTAAAPVDDTFVMPNEVGKNLQAAQDHVQKVSGNPLFQTTSKDATGQDRFQILDRNWTVCGQNVAPGTKVDGDSEIEFSVVKDDESCP